MPCLQLSKLLDSIRLGLGVVLTAWGVAIILGVLLPKIREQFPETTAKTAKEIVDRLLQEVREELRDQRPQ